MTPISEMTTAQLFDQLVLNARAMATITEEIYGEARMPDPREMAEILEKMGAAQYFAMVRVSHDRLTRINQMVPIMLSIMGDMIELERTVLDRIEEGA